MEKKSVAELFLWIQKHLRAVSSGLSIDSPDAVNPSRWRGKNRLGTLMDAVREKLWVMEEYRPLREEVENQMNLFSGYADLYFSSRITRSRHSISAPEVGSDSQSSYGSSRRHTIDSALRKRSTEAEEDLIAAVYVEKRRRSQNKSEMSGTYDHSDVAPPSRKRFLSNDEKNPSSSKYASDQLHNANHNGDDAGRHPRRSVESSVASTSKSTALLDVVDPSLQEILLPGDVSEKDDVLSSPEDDLPAQDEASTQAKIKEDVAERLRNACKGSDSVPPNEEKSEDTEFRMRKKLTAKRMTSEKEDDRVGHDFNLCLFVIGFLVFTILWVFSLY
ncbi:hypothetical protein COOONC_11253 [Cooperia oncophora]